MRVSAGDRIPPLSRRVSQADIDRYAEASGDHNAIHLDPGFARAAGLPGTIAHGLLEMAILAEAVGRWAGGERLTRLTCRFSKPLRAGDTITCSGHVVAVGEATADLELEATSDRNERVLTHGRATVRLAG
ncbi:MAG: MaoC family dehydratase [Candidatus Dormibacteria bacterium]